MVEAQQRGGEAEKSVSEESDPDDQRRLQEKTAGLFIVCPHYSIKYFLYIKLFNRLMWVD